MGNDDSGPDDLGSDDLGSDDLGSDDLGSPDHELSGATVDEAVETAEEGSQVEGVHTPSGQAASGESRVEQMPEVHGPPLHDHDADSAS